VTVKPWGARETIVAEFTPPEQLPPAMLGVLKDERADTLDVTSTIVDLASRGYLQIKEQEKAWIFGTRDYQLVRTDKADTDLFAYEQLLLDRLFAGRSEVHLSSLKESFYRDLSDVKDALRAEIVQRKYFPEDPDQAKNRYFGLGVAILVGGGLGLFYGLSQRWWWLVAMTAGLLVVGLALAAVSRSMSRRTALGREMYRRTRGYELFIATAERYQQRFFEQQNLFTQVLPYAMMFGLTQKFAQAMEQIGYQPPQPSWYIGTTPFRMAAFASSLDSASKALSNTMASAPSSSGSGGGGFSGGGFGGGGGGSW
jgi:uncharacterized membrane protein